MQEYDEDVSHFESRFAGDKGVFAKFYIHPKQNEEESAKAGRPIFDDKEYIEIFTPGALTNIVRRPASQQDKERFRAAYRAFKEKEDDSQSGTHLSQVTFISKSQVEELAYSRIRTVEQLANVNDDVCTRIPGLYSLREKAKAYLEQAEKNAPITAMQAENEELRAQLNALQEVVKDQTAMLKKLAKEKEKAAD